MGIFDDEMNAERLRSEQEEARKEEAAVAAERAVQLTYERDTELVVEFAQTMRRRGVLPEISTWPTVRKTTFKGRRVLGRKVAIQGWLITAPLVRITGTGAQPARPGLHISADATALVGVAKTAETTSPFATSSFGCGYRWEPLSIDHYRSAYLADWVDYVNRRANSKWFVSNWIESSLLEYVRHLP